MRSLNRALVFNDIDNLFRCDDNDVTGFDFLIDLLNGFADFMFLHTASLLLYAGPGMFYF